MAVSCKGPCQRCYDKKLRDHFGATCVQYLWLQRTQMVLRSPFCSPWHLSPPPIKLPFPWSIEVEENICTKSLKEIEIQKVRRERGVEASIEDPFFFFLETSLLK